MKENRQIGDRPTKPQPPLPFIPRNPSNPLAEQPATNQNEKSRRKNENRDEIVRTKHTWPKAKRRMSGNEKRSRTPNGWGNTQSQNLGRTLHNLASAHRRRFRPVFRLPWATADCATRWLQAVGLGLVGYWLDRKARDGYDWDVLRILTFNWSTDGDREGWGEIRREVATWWVGFRWRFWEGWEDGQIVFLFEGKTERGERNDFIRAWGRW